MAPSTPRKCLASVSPEEAKRLVDNAIYEFEGRVDHLETAIGVLFIGRIMGWWPYC